MKAALCILLLMPALAFGQAACSVDLIFPQLTVELSSNACYWQIFCHPNPEGCRYNRELVEPVTLTLIDPALAYEVLTPNAQVGIISDPISFNITQQWFGQYGAQGFYVDAVFLDNFD